MEIGNITAKHAVIAKEIVEMARNTKKFKTEEEVYNKRYEDAWKEIKEIVNRSIEKHGPLASLHESFGVMYEEVFEFFDEVRKKKPDKENTRLELLQIAAVCIKTLDIL